MQQQPCCDKHLLERSKNRSCKFSVQAIDMGYSNSCPGQVIQGTRGGFGRRLPRKEQADFRGLGWVLMRRTLSGSAGCQKCVQVLALQVIGQDK
jgi:hypothetical protein